MIPASSVHELVWAPQWFLELAELDTERCEVVLLKGGGFAVLPLTSPLLARQTNIIRLPGGN